MATKIDAPRVPRGAEALLDSDYATYLNVTDLWDIQSSVGISADLHHAEEFFFRTVHLTCELWLRLASFELERAVKSIESGQLGQALRQVRRSSDALDRVTDATLMFESMPVAEYHTFRIYFGDATGLQSPGYAYIRQASRELSEAFNRLVPSDDELYDVYANQIDGPVYALCEELLSLDAGLDRFRSAHVQIAQRFLHESTVGTGGQGIGYLRSNIGIRVFPRLWDVRKMLADAAGAKSRDLPS